MSLKSEYVAQQGDFMANQNIVWLFACVEVNADQPVFREELEGLSKAMDFPVIKEKRFGENLPGQF